MAYELDAPTALLIDLAAMKRWAITLAVMVPVGSFALLGAVYWLVFAETVRVTITALREPPSGTLMESRRGA